MKQLLITIFAVFAYTANAQNEYMHISSTKYLIKPKNVLTQITSSNYNYSVKNKYSNVSLNRQTSIGLPNQFKEQSYVILNDTIKKDNLQLAGYHMKKGTNQIFTGVGVLIGSVGLGFLTGLVLDSTIPITVISFSGGLTGLALGLNGLRNIRQGATYLEKAGKTLN